MHSPSTRLWSRAYSTGSAGWARLVASAIWSLRQYEPNANAVATSTAMAMPQEPRPTP